MNNITNELDDVKVFKQGSLSYATDCGVEYVLKLLKATAHGMQMDVGLTLHAQCKPSEYHRLF